MRSFTLSHRSTKLRVTIILALLFLFFWSGIRQSALGENVTLSWNPNNEADLAGYKIYKRTLPATEYGFPIFSGVPNNPSAPQLTVTNLTERASYGFIATAFDASGNESPPSLEKQITVAASENDSVSTIEEPLAPVTTQDESSPITEEQISVATSGKEITSTVQGEQLASDTTENESSAGEEERSVNSSENTLTTVEPVVLETTGETNTTLAPEQLTTDTLKSENPTTIKERPTASNNSEFRDPTEKKKHKTRKTLGKKAEKTGHSTVD